MGHLSQKFYQFSLGFMTMVSFQLSGLSNQQTLLMMSTHLSPSSLSAIAESIFKTDFTN